MKIAVHTGLVGVACILSSTLATSVAIAADESGGASLEEVVVTAQKRAENLQKVPIAVTALTASELTNGGIESQLTLPKVTPNFNFTLLSTFAAAYIRGVGTQFANPGLEPSVSVYMDDAYIARGISGIFSFNDIAQVEVLKGPQGTLYGRNATGGAVRIVTNDPKLGVLEGNVSGTVGTDDRIKVGGVLNVPMGERVALRLAAQHDENDGFIDNRAPTGRSRLETRDEEVFAGKLLIEATDELIIKISADYERKKDTEGFNFKNMFEAPTQVGQLLGGCVSTSFYNSCNDDPLTTNDVKSEGASARADYDFGAATLVSISTYRKITEDDAADLDGTSAPLQHSHGLAYTKQYTQEFQLNSNADGRLRYVSGLYYLHEKTWYNYYVAGLAIDQGFGALGSAFGIGSSNLLFSAQGPGLTTDSIAPYLQADYDLNDQFTVTIGARYTIEEKKLKGNDPGLAIATADRLPVPGSLLNGDVLGLAGVPGLGGNCVNSSDVLCVSGKDKAKFKELTPRATLSYKPSSDLMFYATYGRGFKSGGFGLPSFGFVDKVNPETLDQYETGWKYQQGALRFNGALFYYRYKNLQLPIVNSATGTTNTKNAATARNYGAEADVAYQVTDKLEVGAGGGYLNAKFDKFNNGPAVTINPTTGALSTILVDDLSHNYLQNAPKFTGYIRATYTQPLNGHGSLQFSPLVNYRSKAYFDVANQFEDESRTLVSARLQWTSESERYWLGVYGENLTDKKYLTNVTPLGVGGFVNVGPPRQLYVTGGIKF